MTAKSGVCLIILLSAGLFGWARPSPGEIIDRVVAVVNDEVISLSEVEQLARTLQAQAGMAPRPKETKTIQRQVLEALIDQKLARAEAKRRGITVSDKDLEQALADFKKRNQITSDEALNQALGKAGITLKELRQQISDQILQDRLMAVVLKSRLSVSEAEVRRYYETEFPKERGQRVHLKVMEMPFPPGASPAQKEEMQKKAEQILLGIRQGSSLEAMGAKFSVPVRDLGFISAGDLNPKLAEFLGRLKPGEVAPIQLPEGFQIIQFMGKKSGQPLSYEEVAPQIRNFLMRQTVEKQFSQWVKTLREKAVIKIML